MTVGTGGIAGGGSVYGEEDELDMDLGDDMDDMGGDDLDLDLGDEAGDLGDDVDLEGGDDAIEVSCPSCGDSISVRLVPEADDLGGDDLDLDLGGDDLDLDVGGDDLDVGGEDLGAGGPSEVECFEGVDPNVIASLLTEDPDIFTKR
jgi:hypothetical protein